ncbi:MAG TPA: DUF565 domain-containing protein [Chroococcidiopsis sp.]
MQNTRLNSLVSSLFSQLGQWLRNPWRRISLLLISLLLGNFLATAFSTVSGQNADLDIVVALIVLVITEAISWLSYGSPFSKTDRARGTTRPLVVDALNGLKLGTLYGLIVEAFKLGS